MTRTVRKVAAGITTAGATAINILYDMRFVFISSPGELDPF
jgi:hypothetical protein